MNGLFKRAFGKRRADDPPADCDAVPPVVSRGGEGVIRVNMDAFDADERKELYGEFARRTDIPVYDGHVEHAYSKHNVSDVHECPRCHARAERQYAHFIYATQVAPRVMFAPAGHFCTDCPCVIVDEDLIKDGILDRQFRYLGVLGVDYGGKQKPDLFRTWNGQKAIHVFDEDQRPLGIATSDGLQRHRVAALAGDFRAHRKKRRKTAKRLRKRNRQR